MEIHLNIQKKTCPNCGGNTFEIDANDLHKGDSDSFPDNGKNLLSAICTNCGEKTFLTVQVEVK